MGWNVERKEQQEAIKDDSAQISGERPTSWLGGSQQGKPSAAPREACLLQEQPWEPTLSKAVMEPKGGSQSC